METYKFIYRNQKARSTKIELNTQKRKPENTKASYNEHLFHGTNADGTTNVYGQLLAARIPLSIGNNKTILSFK